MFSCFHVLPGLHVLRLEGAGGCCCGAGLVWGRVGVRVGDLLLQLHQGLQVLLLMLLLLLVARQDEEQAQDALQIPITNLC